MKRGVTTGAVCASALLLTLAYLLNLGSGYAPTNGDEMVYLHIARLTSESGHWLPLQSELANMRNTKPPLLFWQAMATGGWAWSLWLLRLPYVLETLLTAALVGQLAWLLTQVGVSSLSRTLAPQASPRRGDFSDARKWQEVAMTALLAATLYLGFFTTYRYGRPVLSSSIESLFLFAACALVITKMPLWGAYPARLAVLLGLLTTPALLAKSFVLALPVALWFFLVLWSASTPGNKTIGQKLWRCTWPSALAMGLGLAGFALWFFVDPNPAAVWHEFVIGENFSKKFDSAWSDGLATFWLSPFANAGLLSPLLVGLLLAAWRNWRDKTMATPLGVRLLWLWLLVWMLVFTLPSQRSGRYILPAMPALAVLLALYASAIARVWWMLTLALIALATAALAWTAYSLGSILAVDFGYSPFYFVALALVLLMCVIGLLRAKFRVALVAASSVAWLALLGALAAPFDQGAGQFDTQATQAVAEQKVWLPQNFNAQFERFQFALPHHRALPYAASQAPTPSALLQTAPYAVIALPLDAPMPADDARVRILASRFVFRSRQNAGEITWKNLSNAHALARLLVQREVLIDLKKQVL